jgi:alpha-beta hydrolase superfamily lysophospholipase
MAPILFLHGWTSKPGGVKPTFLSQHGHTVLNPALPDDDFGESVRIAQVEFDKRRPGVVVGSSRGGAVAMNILCEGAALVLLCPAWKRWGTANTIKPSTVILHSEADQVVPIAASRELLVRSGLSETSLIVVGNDHRLADPESLDALLAAIESSCRQNSSRGA